MSDIDTAELRRVVAGPLSHIPNPNTPEAYRSWCAATIAGLRSLPALLDELDRLRELHRENSRTIQEASDELDRLRERVKELEQLTRDTAWELDRMCAHSRLLRTEPVRQMAVAYPLAITQLAKVADALGWLKLTASLADDIDQAARALEAIRLRAAGG